MTQRRPHSRGFTLVELMVVVAVIAVIATLFFSVNIQTYGTSSMSVADELVSNLNLCKMRAVSTRRWHACVVGLTTPTANTPAYTTFTISQWTSIGMTTPTLPAVQWPVVQSFTVGNGVAVWDASAVPCAEGPCTGAPTAPNPALSFEIDFRPDGSSTGGTLFVSDTPHNKVYRVVVYQATGSSYARNSW